MWYNEGIERRNKMKQVILPKNTTSILWNVCAELLNQDDIIVRLHWHKVACSPQDKIQDGMHDVQYIDESWSSNTKSGTIGRLCALLNDLGSPTEFSITTRGKEND